MNPQNRYVRFRGYMAAACLIALLSLSAAAAAQTTTCSAPSSPGVNICSPADGSFVQESFFTVSAAGTNTNGTDGMDVWLDGIKLGFFANTTAVDIENLNASVGPHQLDIYAVGVDGELRAQTSFFKVFEIGCFSFEPGVLCSPANGSSAALPFAIFANGTFNPNGTAGMDVWLDGFKLGFFANTTNVNINAAAAGGPHQLDIFAVGVNGEKNLQSSVFTVLAPDCNTPASPGVNICSPGNGSTKASPMNIVALGRNSGPTDGMDVWLDGSKLGFFQGNTVAMTNVKAGIGSHRLDIFAVGVDGELKLQSSFFTVVPCAFPASGVHICSPANGALVRSPFTITAAGRNINGTDGMDVWLDGTKLGFFADTTTVNLDNVKASLGRHQLDIFAVGVDGEKKLQSSVFNACPIPDSPGVNICAPASGSTQEFALNITAAGRNSGPTAGMDVWMNGRKLGFFPGNFVDTILIPPGFGGQPLSAQLDIFAVGVDGELQLSSVVFTFNPAL
jgi:hypothetical protein